MLDRGGVVDFWELKKMGILWANTTAAGPEIRRFLVPGQ
jgi:hypothetical protein